MNMADRQSGAEGPDPAGHRGRPRVVVGIDGSPGSREALVQALLAAARRGADLEVVTAYSLHLFYAGGAPLDVPDVAAIRNSTRERAQSVLDEVSQEVTVSAVPGIQDVGMSLLVKEGSAAHVLVDRSADSALLVIGSRGRSAMRTALLGSVALHCVTHASCPVVVVHPAVAISEPPRVVVGVDGSAGSRAALAAAVDEAARTGAEVEVVATYAIADYWTDLATVVVPSVEQIRAELCRRTDQMVEAVLDDRRHGGGPAVPRVHVVVLEGPPAEVLVDRARTATLLVVGSRGHGTLRGLLLGSVALQCAMHAPGPVMVVHPQPSRTSSPAVSRESALVDH
jgi:nucleotide-binding universal stress UspA family protein